MSGILFLGAGGHGRSVADIASACGYSHIAFADDRYPDIRNTCDWQIVCKAEDVLIGHRPPPIEGFDLFVSIGNRFGRRSIDEKLGCLPMPSLVSPHAHFSTRSQIGPGSVVMAGASVNVASTIGRCAIINTGATVDHDCSIGDYVHLSPGVNLGGHVTIGEGTWIGIGATVRNGITIGKNAMVAAGAVVVSDVPDEATVMGVPAKRVDKT